MARRILSTDYIVPILTDGTEAAIGSGSTFGTTSSRGVHTLASGTTYYVPIAAADARYAGLQLQGDAALVLTSVTLEECYLATDEATNGSDNIGEWLAADPARVSTAVEGTGWSAANGVIASVGGNAGGSVQNLKDTAARRVRAKVVVGATGGNARFTAWAKE